METIEQPAHNAATREPSGVTPASRLTSTQGASCSTAGIVDITAARQSGISDLAAEWVRITRKISLGTLERLGVASGTTFFPDAGDKLKAIFFRYPDGWKARAFPEKHFVASKGFKLSFWNIEQVLQANPRRVYITEGEFDALALVEAGIAPGQVLSVPNGAKAKASDNPDEAKGYDYVRHALAGGLNRAKEIVWCGDNDAPGLVLRSDMAKMFGAARFHFVNWPDGAKDANDLLKTDGPQFLRGLVEDGSLPWPVDGLFRMSELPEPAPLTLWNPGFPEWENKVRLAARTMSVVTGHPGHGKTALWSQIWFNVVRAYCVPMVVASFETRPKPHYRRNLRTFFSGKLEKDMSDEETRKADAFINERYLFAVHPEHRPALSWFLDLAEVAVIRHGARIIQVDPWNRMEAARGPNESETEYIGRCLREIHAFAHDMNCHVQILAHPAKMDGKRRGDAPGLEDISGSKNWDNMVDQGFVVHRPEMFDGNERKTNADLLHRKARFEELGYPCRLAMNYDIKSGLYRSEDYKTGAY
jgi:twinkle protein